MFPVPLKPTLTVQNNVVNYQTGANTDLTCVSVGADQYQFYKGGSPVTSDGFTASDTLTITNFQLVNQGAYTCKGKNGAGEAASDALTLTLSEFFFHKLNKDITV